MTGSENETEEVVANVVIERFVDLGRESFVFGLKFSGKLLVFLLKTAVAAKLVDGAALSDSHQPCPGVIGHARRGPLFEGRHERVLREVFGQAHIVDHPREPRNESWGFDAPDCVNRAM